jgi:L-iditol 2-dehydrogenase
VRALVKTEAGPGHVALLDRPEPVCGPGQVKIRMVAAGVCGTDVHILRGEWATKPPIILGHELAGMVAETGPGVTEFQVGELVTTETDAYVCGECEYCRAGNEHMCASRKAIGTTVDGGFADYLVIRAESVHRLPARVSLVAGALAEPLAVAVHAVQERAQVRPGELVAIIGPGTIGLLAAQVARALGARVIVAGLARHAARFRLARQLGIEHTLDLDDPRASEQFADLSAGLGPDAVIECSGAPSALQQAIRLVRKGGRVVPVGFASRPTIEIDIDLLINKEITLVASRGKRHSCWDPALKLLAEGQVDSLALITHRFTLEEWREALDAARQPGTKVLLQIVPEPAVGSVDRYQDRLAGGGRREA